MCTPREDDDKTKKAYLMTRKYVSQPIAPTAHITEARLDNLFLISEDLKSNFFVGLALRQLQ